MISLFMHGGLSHVDLFDPKPALGRSHGTDYGGDAVFSFANRASKKLFGSPWKFSKHGQCGTEVSDLLPETARIVDDLSVIRSMHTGHNGHEVSIRYFHGGLPAIAGRPTMGSWLVYGLGSESQSLPSYKVLADADGHPVDGTINWSSGFMPTLYQGTVLRSQEPRILNLDPPQQLAGLPQRQNLAFLVRLNRRHLEQHPGESDLESRIHSFELAAAMQTPRRKRSTSRASPSRHGASMDSTTTRPASMARAVSSPAGWWCAACGSCSSFSPASRGTITRRFARRCPTSAGASKDRPRHWSGTSTSAACWKRPSSTGAARSAACPSARVSSTPAPGATTTGRASPSGLPVVESRGPDVRRYRRGWPPRGREHRPSE